MFHFQLTLGWILPWFALAIFLSPLLFKKPRLPYTTALSALLALFFLASGITNWFSKQYINLRFGHLTPTSYIAFGFAFESSHGGTSLTLYKLTQPLSIFHTPSSPPILQPTLFWENSFQSIPKYPQLPGTGLHTQITTFQSLGYGFATAAGPIDPMDASYSAVTSLLLPNYFLILLFSLLPLYSLRQYRKSRIHQHRQKNNLCLQCGYNPHTLPSPTRCPECGASGTRNTPAPTLAQVRHPSSSPEAV